MTCFFQQSSRETGDFFSAGGRRRGTRKEAEVPETSVCPYLSMTGSEFGTDHFANLSGGRPECKKNLH